MVDINKWQELIAEFIARKVTLIAVSKKKPVSDILELYNAGHRDFGENYVQELVEKQALLPKDIRWHFIGHLQSNKVKMIAPFVSMIHAVDSLNLLKEINKSASKNNRKISVLLQLHIADEETKFGLNENEIESLLQYYITNKSHIQNVKLCGLMGMATNTTDVNKIRQEFSSLYLLQQKLSATFLGKLDDFSTCSMGMSGDYGIAIEEGSNMVRIGSLIFGER